MEEAAMRPIARFGWVTCIALLGLALCPAPAARAGEPVDSSEAADLLATRILGAAELRMKAKVEEARLLEAAGRRDEALAALREVATIHEQALARADAVRAAPARRVRFAEPPSPSGATPLPSRPLPRVAPPPVPDEPRWLAKVEPVRGAVRYLLRAQRPDGHFGSLAAPVDPQTTAFSVVALLDAVEDDATEAMGAIRRGASALAALDPDVLPDPALVGWALAAAYARLGDAAWREPLRRLAARVDLHVADGEGRRVLLSHLGSGERALRALWILVFLEEIDPLEETLPEDGRLTALRRDLLALVPGLDLPSEGAPAYARDLLRLAADLPDDSPGARGPSAVVDGFRPVGSWMRGGGTTHDPLALLLGTVYVRERFGTDDPREGTVWWNRVLVRAADRQVQDGAEAGSWASGDVRSRSMGTVWTTAVTLLAWRAWDVPWRAPVAR
jgi:hypothetical protein